MLESTRFFKVRLAVGLLRITRSGWQGIRVNSTGCGSVRLEHTVRDREVEGSNPSAPTNIKRPFPGVFFFGHELLLLRDRYSRQAA